MGLSAVLVQVAGRIAPCLPLSLHLCRRNEAPYLQGSLPVVRKEQCSESREPDSSPGSAPSAPYSELQLSRLSNGHGTRWSLSCCPELIMEFCMNSKEESGHKCIHSTLMGLFSLVSFTYAALLLQRGLARPSSSGAREEKVGEG